MSNMYGTNFESLRGRNSLEEEPLSNAEAAAFLEARANQCTSNKIPVPPMIRNTLQDYHKITRNLNSMYDRNSIQKRKEKLLTLAYEDNGQSKLDLAEVCQILNLNPESTKELIAYIPSLSRFKEYQLSLILDE